MTTTLRGVTLRGNTQLGAGVPLLFTKGEQGAWYDPSDFTTLFQDSAGTVPVTAAGDPVGKMLDKSGKGNHATQATAANRPILRADGPRWYLEFDGATSNRWMQTGSVNFTGTNAVSIWGGVYKTSEATRGMIVELSATAGSNAGSFLFDGPSASANQFSVGAYLGTPLRCLNNSMIGTCYVVSAVFDKTQTTSAAQISIRRNQSSADAGTVNPGLDSGYFGNWPLYIGRRGGTSLPFNGRLYSLIIRGAATSAAQISNIERIVAKATGVSL